MKKPSHDRNAQRAATHAARKAKGLEKNATQEVVARDRELAHKREHDRRRHHHTPDLNLGYPRSISVPGFGKSGSLTDDLMIPIFVQKQGETFPSLSDTIVPLGSADSVREHLGRAP